MRIRISSTDRMLHRHLQTHNSKPMRRQERRASKTFSEPWEEVVKDE